MNGPSRNRLVAVYVALRDPDDYPEGTCVAWMDGPEKVCGKPAEYLCARHVKVALRRFEKACEKADREKARLAAKREAQRPAQKARLAKIEAELDRIDPLRTDPCTDTAMVNLPLSKRLPSASRIHRLSQLHEEREQLCRALGVTS